MNKRIAAAVVAPTVLAAAAVSAWAATTDGATASTTQGRTLVVVERALTDTTVDIGKKGDSRGDQLAFGNPVYNATNTKRVGHDLGFCVRTTPKVSYECTWTLRVKGGTIAVTGPFLDAGDSTLAITGGTGKYEGATGQMLLHALNKAGSRYRFTYHLG